mmetsp:Transcript_14228/g.44831  ORF Transcript_14228/g.44831 Transcript_14228/m.44831 type:complete len:320 (+) Transcript_14228:54-1013(+)
MATPCRKTEKAYWAVIVTQSNVVLDSEIFLLADYRIIKKLLQLEEFGVVEDRLWVRLLLWASGTKEHPDLIACVSSSLDEQARKRSRSEETSDALRQRAHKSMVLKELIEHVRFPVMDQSFFLVRAANYLSRKQERSVLAFHLLECTTKFSTSKRTSVPPTESVPIVMDGSSTAAAHTLLQGSANWPCVTGSPPLNPTFGELSFGLPSSSGSKISIVEVEFEFSANRGLFEEADCAARFELCTVGNPCGKSSGCCRKGTRRQRVSLSGLPPARAWQLKIKGVHGWGAQLAKLAVRGRISVQDWATTVVESRAALLLSSP